MPNLLAHVDRPHMLELLIFDPGLFGCLLVQKKRPDGPEAEPVAMMRKWPGDNVDHLIRRFMYDSYVQLQ